MLASTELDTRLLGMVIALVVIWIAFNIRSGGDFLTARNLWNLSVQSTSIAIMATGMVLIIVSRNIDLSVGSLLGFLGYTMAIVQTDGMIAFFGLDVTIGGLRNSSYAWIVALAVGVVLGALIGGLTGLHRRLRRGPLVHRDARRLPRLAGRDLPHRGQAGPDARPARRDVPAASAAEREERSASGGAGCSPSWPAPVSRSASTCSRRRRQRYDLAVRPMWVDVGLGVVGCVAVVAGVALIANRYDSPVTGKPTGVAYPVVILIGVTLVDDLPRPAAPLRTLRVRVRRQPRGCRAERHQHPPHGRCSRSS